MITISTKGKYGLAAMTVLAEHFNQGPIQIKTIADRHQIPQNYLEQLLVQLKRAGLVKSFRGSSGGYALARAPEQIQAAEVLNCLEGPCRLCDNHEDVLAGFWQEAEAKVSAVFDVSLMDVLQKSTPLVSYSI
ncbi:MAG: Rrf2 family transcriptional regulator [Candidatus Margulisiibacteriota bacterium]